MRSKLERLEQRYDKLNDELNNALDREEALKAEVAGLKQELTVLVDWTMGDRDALACLQSIYNSTTASEANRAKAAAAAIGYERAKPASTTLVVDFRERVRQARLWADAKLLAQPKTIEHIPDAPAPLPDAS